jgi:hypothetical protein
MMELIGAVLHLLTANAPNRHEAVTFSVYCSE